jgi:hypothetical protein
MGHEYVEGAVTPNDPLGQLGVAGCFDGGALRFGELMASPGLPVATLLFSSRLTRSISIDRSLMPRS